MILKVNGHPTKYLFYESNKKSIVTVPRAIIDAANLNWNHQDQINIIVKTIDGQQGLFLFKKSSKKKGIKHI